MLPGGIVGIGELAVGLAARCVVLEHVRRGERMLEGHHGAVECVVGQLDPAQQIPGVEAVFPAAFLLEILRRSGECVLAFHRHEAEFGLVFPGGAQRIFRFLPARAAGDQHAGQGRQQAVFESASHARVSSGSRASGG